MIGYSLRGSPSGVARDLITWCNTSEAPVLSVDVPSGIDSTTGDSSGAFVAATKTMTLALPKTGLDVEAVGSLVLSDIGIPITVYERAGVYVPANLFEIAVHGRGRTCITDSG